MHVHFDISTSALCGATVVPNCDRESQMGQQSIDYIALWWDLRCSVAQNWIMWWPYIAKTGRLE